MVGTVVFPTLSGLRRAGSRRQQVAGPVCCSLRAAGRVPVLRNPANCNRAVPLIGCRSGHGVAAAWVESDKVRSI
jgi:hypothetical protein